MLSQEQLQEGNRGLGIRSLKSFHNKLLAQDIQRSIVRLLLTFVSHWHFDAFVGFAPHIAAEVAPEQMTFILEQDD